MNKLLTLEEREKIGKLCKTPLSFGDISKEIGRSKNCILAEIKRNGGREQYDFNLAHESANLRLSKKYNAIGMENTGKKRQYFMKKRLENLEMQMEILHDTIKGLLDDRKN